MFGNLRFIMIFNNFLLLNQHNVPTLPEVRARGLLILGKKHCDHQNWERLMKYKRTGLPFSID